MGDIAILKDAGSVAEAAATRIEGWIAAALDSRGRCSIALSGGRTPRDLYRRLAAGPIDWSRVRIYFADERAVPPEDADSNFRMARETLIDPARIPPRNVHRMKGEYPDLAVAVEEYEAHLTEPLDAVVLGIGEDGHVASLFPNHAALGETVRRVAAVLDAPRPPPRRLTLTPRALAEARDVMVLATGAGKAAAVAEALEEEGPARDLPARLVRDRTWRIDRAAGSKLERVR
jgi:6-phosphogluconolactonase